MTSFLSSSQKRSLVHDKKKCQTESPSISALTCQRPEGHRGLHIGVLSKDGAKLTGKWKGDAK
jgi:hypothetical protein